MSDLDRLFYWRGIAASYLNYRGEHIDVPIENRVNLLKTMGVDLGDEETIAKAAYELDVATWQRFSPPLQTTKVGDSSGFYLNLHPDSLNKTFIWRLLKDNEELINGSFVAHSQREIGDYQYGDIRYSRRFVPVVDLDIGYYTVSIRESDWADSEAHLAQLAVTPHIAFQPDWVNRGEKLWGTLVQLYTLRSDRNWGIGDFSDLNELIKYLAGCGGSFVGLNPLHALLPDTGNHFSPYSPSDRRFINPLYIDIEHEEDFDRDFMAMDGFDLGSASIEIKHLRELDNVCYARVKELKYSAFEQMFSKFLSVDLAAQNPRATVFWQYLLTCSDTLPGFALYEAQHLYRQSPKYVLSNSFSISDIERQFTLCHRNELDSGDLSEDALVVLFHCYLQWLANDQLERCQVNAKALGMRLGLIRDLAVGADGAGAEVNQNAELFSCGAAVGAPPDPMAEQGQNWGLPPLDPAALRKDGFKHFSALLRLNMSHCGALRIDHAMSLLRLWWCPPGKTADYGAYIYYPFEEMLGLLLLESHLNKCMIIGEDLGVVPEEFRRAMDAVKLFGNRVFYFEKEGHDQFKTPENYDAYALAMVNNHDVPSLTSWWNGKDLLLRDKLNIFEEGSNYALANQQRQHEKAKLASLMQERGVWPAQWSGADLSRSADKDLIYSILMLSASVNSKLFAIQLEDLVLMEDPVNVPGTYKEHNNWQRKLVEKTTTIFDDHDIRGLLQSLHDLR